MIKDMKLDKNDLDKCIVSMPPVISELVKSGFYIGGGFIRSVLNQEPIADFDIFGSNLPQIEKEIELFKLTSGNRVFIGNTYNAYTVRIQGEKPIQFITKWLFDTPELCMKSFDFAICRAVIFWNKETNDFDSVIDPDFYYSLRQKQLIYCNPIREEVAAGSFLRMQKFILKGYKISPENLAKVTARMLFGMSKKNKLFSLIETECEYEKDIMHMFDESNVDFRGNY